MLEAVLAQREHRLLQQLTSSGQVSEERVSALRTVLAASAKHERLQFSRHLLNAAATIPAVMASLAHYLSVEVPLCLLDASLSYGPAAQVQAAQGYFMTLAHTMKLETESLNKYAAWEERFTRASGHAKDSLRAAVTAATAVTAAPDLLLYPVDSWQLKEAQGTECLATSFAQVRFSRHHTLGRRV